MPRASIVIPAYNHAVRLRRAVDSALAQTLAAEVVVVDDASTDETPAVIAEYAERVTAVRARSRGGPARARNVGLGVTSGEFVMFLDADDEVAPTKVAEQVAVLDADRSAGWVYCDVEIRDDARNRRVLASEKYGYALRRREGDLLAELLVENFIPVHAPLVRRACVPGPFDERAAREDWDFWVRVAAASPARYVPRVLATYHVGAGGRNTLPNSPAAQREEQCRHDESTRV